VDGQARLDLDYVEDSSAEVDANIIMTADGQMVEIQASGEESTFSEDQLSRMLSLGKAGIQALIEKQRAALGLGGLA
jgi:ribonuclease PH